MRIFSILYYTNDYDKYKKFCDKCYIPLSIAFNAGTHSQILDSFVLDKKSKSPLFFSLRDLTNYLENYKNNLSDLTIVMDCKLLQKDAKKTLQTLLIEYLEISFVFDKDPTWIIFNQGDIKEIIKNQSVDVCEQCLNELENCTEKGVVKQEFKDKILTDRIDTGDYWAFLKILFKNHKDYEEQTREIRKQLIRRIAHNYVNFDSLMLPEKNGDFILNLVHSQDNLFDSSNIRYCIKQWKYAELDVHSRNFLLIQNSRRDKLAICVEEEHEQNRFNSYCLFACGFRVLPITSATELQKVNKNIKKFNPSLIIRDYDLQFFDSSSIHYGSEGDYNGSIKAIRGYRDDYNNGWTTHVIDSPCWNAFYKDYQKQTSKKGGIKGFPQATEALICNTAPSYPIYFVSKGTWNVKVNLPISFISENRNNKDKNVVYASHYFTDINGVNTLCVPGLSKPVSGIYEPLLCIPQIRKIIENTKVPLSEYIDTSREGHAHGTSLDIYATVLSLIQRAELYYNKGKYIHAAILSNEAIEYLNGFHEALLIKAYQILTISENAIAMNTIGGDEYALKEDTLFRINKIEYDIDRILRRKKEGIVSNDDRQEFKYNILNQIFSTCRKFCKEKEHFSSENCFISAMAHTNEGYTPCDIWHDLKTIFKRIRKGWSVKKNTYKYGKYNK